MSNCKKCWDTGKLKIEKSNVSYDGKRQVGFEGGEEIFCSCPKGQELKDEKEEESNG